ncbi:MAG: hypothetical protein ACFB8W_21265 [Elainellaceae cyanobacterium]
MTFQPHQILCLEHHHRFLYAELIQAISQRGVVWVRPLALKTLATNAQLPHAVSGSPHYWADLELSCLHDMRQSSDLLWPTVLFREALDVEVIPLLAHLSSQKRSLQSDHSAREQFQQFIHQVWQDHANLFPAGPIATA